MNLELLDAYCMLAKNNKNKQIGQPYLKHKSEIIRGFVKLPKPLMAGDRLFILGFENFSCRRVNYDTVSTKTCHLSKAETSLPLQMSEFEDMEE